MIFDFVSVGEQPLVHNRTQVDVRFIPYIIAPVDIALINRPPGTSLPERCRLSTKGCLLHGSHSHSYVASFT